MQIRKAEGMAIPSKNLYLLFRAKFSLFPAHSIFAAVVRFVYIK